MSMSTRTEEGNVIKSWDRSVEMLERSRRSLAGGVSSPFRAKAPVPLFLEGGKGARLTDVDGTNTSITSWPGVR